MISPGNGLASGCSDFSTAAARLKSFGRVRPKLFNRAAAVEKSLQPLARPLPGEIIRQRSGYCMPLRLRARNRPPTSHLRPADALVATASGQPDAQDHAAVEAYERQRPHTALSPTR